MKSQIIFKVVMVIGLWMAMKGLPAAAEVALDEGRSGGQQIYRQRCAVCHDHPQDRIPPKEVLGTHKHDYIVRVLTTGLMQMQASGLSAEEIDAVAAYLIDDVKSVGPAGYRPPDLEDPSLQANLCKHAAGRFVLDPSDWNGFSPDLANTRFQTRPGLRVSDVRKLKPKWVFAYPGARAYGPPSVTSGRVFLGTVLGSVLSLDAKTGCTYWATEPGAPVRTTVSVGKWSASLEAARRTAHFAAYFGDSKAVVHAVDAETGEPLWSTKVDDHAFATISGHPALHQGKLYVPLTSGEGSMGPRGDYPCCTFRGSIVALDAYTGKILWKTYTISEEPKPYKLNAAGTQMYAPAGVGIWSALTVDVKRALVYGTTGESKTALSVKTSDAILAFDRNTGSDKWAMQATSNDNWIQGCEATPPGANCPDPLGPDADFDTPAMLHAIRNGRSLLVAAEKSGLITAVDPDSAGKILWQRNLALEAVVPSGAILRDRAQLGVVFGMAADESNIYAAVADPSTDKGHVPLGVYALDVSDGTIVWHAPGAPVPSCSWGEKGCAGAQRTAVASIPGAVFSGSANGHMRAYAAKNGEVIWDFDTARTYAAVNGVTAQGGSIEGVATVIANGTVYVMSGFASYGGGMGDVLIAFSVNGK